MPRAFRPTAAPPTRSAQGVSCQSEPRKLAQGPGHRQGSSGKMAATGYFARSRCMPDRPVRTRQSRVTARAKTGGFLRGQQPWMSTWNQPKKPAKKTRWGLRPGRSILPWECGSGARRPHARSKPEAPPHVWVLPGGGGRPTRFKNVQMACQSWQRRRLFTLWGLETVRAERSVVFFSPRRGRRGRRWPHHWGQPMPGVARSIGPCYDAFRARCVAERSARRPSGRSRRHSV